MLTGFATLQTIHFVTNCKHSGSESLLRKGPIKQPLGLREDGRLNKVAFPVAVQGTRSRGTSGAVTTGKGHR